jgi:hypothetical protein
LSNITNIYQSLDNVVNSAREPIRDKESFGKPPSMAVNYPPPRSNSKAENYTQIFKKPDLIGLVTSRTLAEIIAIFCGSMKTDSVEERMIITPMIEEIISIVQSFKDREMYDALSLRFVNLGIFTPLLKAIGHIQPNSLLDNREKLEIAKILELCACHQQGIQLLQVLIFLISFR